MAKRDVYFAEAEKLYINEYMSLKDIASKLDLNEKTIRAWRNLGDWEPKRIQYLKAKSSFNEEVYEFSKILMESVKKDMSLEKEPHAMSLYALASILPTVYRIKEQEVYLD